MIQIARIAKKLEKKKKQSQVTNIALFEDLLCSFGNYYSGVFDERMVNSINQSDQRAQKQINTHMSIYIHTKYQGNLMKKEQYYKKHGGETYKQICGK